MLSVADLTKRQCLNVADCNRTMELGFGNRSVGATLMNADSSRSHSIFTIYMERCDKDGKGEEHIRAGKLNLVDLAGSERQAKTGMSRVVVVLQLLIGKIVSFKICSYHLRSVRTKQKCLPCFLLHISM